MEKTRQQWRRDKERNDVYKKKINLEVVLLFSLPVHQTDKCSDAVNLVHQVGDNRLITAFTAGHSHYSLLTDTHEGDYSNNTHRNIILIYFIKIVSLYFTLISVFHIYKQFLNMLLMMQYALLLLHLLAAIRTFMSVNHSLIFLTSSVTICFIILNIVLFISCTEYCWQTFNCLKVYYTRE